VVDGRAEDKDEEHHLHDRIAEARVEQLFRFHAPHEHEGEEAGHAGPDDLDEDPAVEDAQEDADKAHAQGGQRLHGWQLAKPEHNEETDSTVDVVRGCREALSVFLSGHGDFPLHGYCCEGEDFLHAAGKAVLFCPHFH
jgi:hypothetical protein